MSAGGPGIVRLDDAGAELLEAADPRIGGVARLRLPAVAEDRRAAQEPDDEPVEARLGDRAPGEHRPERRGIRDGAGERADRVERRAQRVDAVDRDRPEPCLQPDELARGGGQPDRAARVRADPEVAEAGRDRRGVPARRAARRPARAGRGCARCRSTRSRRGRPRRTRRGSPCRGSSRPRRARAGRPSRGASGRGRRRRASRTSSGSRPCRSDP